MDGIPAKTSTSWSPTMMMWCLSQARIKRPVVIVTPSEEVSGDVALAGRPDR